jgi:hypothetical protein
MGVEHILAQLFESSVDEPGVVLEKVMAELSVQRALARESAATSKSISIEQRSCSAETLPPLGLHVWFRKYVLTCRHQKS